MADVKLPHMPLWVYDIDTDEDCRAMPDATFGRYMRLMIRQWIEGSVPADAALCVRTGMLDHDAAADVKSLLDRKFSVRDGSRRLNARCKQEREAATEKVLALRRNGSKGGRKKADGEPFAEPDGSIRASGCGSESLEGKEHQTKPRARTPRDDLWDSIATLFFGGEIQPPDESRVGRLVTRLSQRGATPDELRKRTARYQAKYPKAACTIEAVEKHWQSLDGRNGVARRPAASVVHPAPVAPQVEQATVPQEKLRSIREEIAAAMKGVKP